jgi:hypothetical protein
MTASSKGPGRLLTQQTRVARSDLRQTLLEHLPEMLSELVAG